MTAGPGMLALREEPGICLEELRKGRWGRLEAFTRTGPRQAAAGGSLFFASCSSPLSCLPTARRRAVMALKLAAESLCCQG